MPKAPPKVDPAKEAAKAAAKVEKACNDLVKAYKDGLAAWLAHFSPRDPALLAPSAELTHNSSAMPASCALPPLPAHVHAHPPSTRAHRPAPRATDSNQPLATIDVGALKSTRFLLERPGRRPALPYRDAEGCVNVHLCMASEKELARLLLQKEDVPQVHASTSAHAPPQRHALPCRPLPRRPAVPPPPLPLPPPSALRASGRARQAADVGQACARLVQEHWAELGAGGARARCGVGLLHGPAAEGGLCAWA